MIYNLEMQVKENELLVSHSTFKLGGQARFFAVAEKLSDIPNIVELAEQSRLLLFVLGGGSNCIFGDGLIDKFVVKMNLLGKEILSGRDTEEASSIFVRIASGEILDEVVAWSIDQGLSGLEALSAIPGSIGATPVQNVGAYGSEIKDTLVEVQTYDLKEKRVQVISNEECNFGYRSSIFNTTEKGRYVILSVVLKLSRLPASSPHYPAVRKYFEERGIKQPSGLEIRNAVTYIRWSKLPKPSEIPNVGSFFKNPIVDKDVAEKIKEKFDDFVIFPTDYGKVKVPAGFLIEKASLKGKQFGNFAVYDKNALVITHNGKGTCEELLLVAQGIIDTVKGEFGITLEQEPAIIR